MNNYVSREIRSSELFRSKKCDQGWPVRYFPFKFLRFDQKEKCVKEAGAVLGWAREFFSSRSGTDGMYRL